MASAIVGIRSIAVCCWKRLARLSPTEGRSSRSSRGAPRGLCALLVAGQASRVFFFPFFVDEFSRSHLNHVARNRTDPTLGLVPLKTKPSTFLKTWILGPSLCKSTEHVIVLSHGRKQFTYSKSAPCREILQECVEPCEDQT